MKIFLTVLFGGIVGVVISIVSPYNLTDWQFYAAITPIDTIGVLLISYKE